MMILHRILNWHTYKLLLIIFVFMFIIIYIRSFTKHNCWFLEDGLGTTITCNCNDNKVSKCYLVIINIDPLHVMTKQLHQDDKTKKFCSLGSWNRLLCLRCNCITIGCNIIVHFMPTFCTHFYRLHLIKNLIYS